jgi:hypothetical protein
MSKKVRSGGGIDSNKRREIGYKGGKRSLNDISVEAVVGLGTRTAYPKPDLVKATPKDFVALGNTMTSPCGPKGQGRTLYGQGGSQSQYGKPAQGEGGMQSPVDRGSRAILGEPKSKV